MTSHVSQVVYENARVHTMDPSLPLVSSIAVRGERIVAVGDDCREALSGKTEHVDLGGATVLPGLVDTHIHTANYAYGLSQVDLRGAVSLGECLERIRGHMATLPPGGWLRGGRWDFNRWESRAQPTARDLDSVCPDRPAALPSVDGHTTWVNTLALQRLGYTSDTPDPAGGQIVRDADGHPTGILRERAAEPLKDLVPDADLVPLLKEAQRRLLSAGLTGVHDIDGTDCLEAYETLYGQGQLALRVHKLIPHAALDDAIAAGRFTGAGDALLSTGPVKIFTDGALGSHTSLMTKPFAGEPHNHGIEVLTPDQIFEVVQRASLAGIAIAAHAIGDAANATVLAALRRWRATGVNTHLRHRIEHAQHQRPSDIGAFAELGVIASMQPIHCTSDIGLVETLLADHDILSYPWRSLVDSGAVLSFGSDAPVEDPNPFHGIHAAVTRDGFQPHECLTVYEAIRAYTVTAAYASCEEHRKGMLRPGMLADFIAVDTDPFTCDLAALRDIRPTFNSRSTPSPVDHEVTVMLDGVS